MSYGLESEVYNVVYVGGLDGQKKLVAKVTTNKEQFDREVAIIKGAR